MAQACKVFRINADRWGICHCSQRIIAQNECCNRFVWPRFLRGIVYRKFVLKSNRDPMRSGQEYNESIRITHYLEILMMEMSKHRTLLPGIRPCLNFPYPAFGGIISLLLLPKRMPSTPISKPFMTSPLLTRKLIVPWSNILPFGLLNLPIFSSYCISLYKLPARLRPISLQLVYPFLAL